MRGSPFRQPEPAPKPSGHEPRHAFLASNVQPRSQPPGQQLRTPPPSLTRLFCAITFRYPTDFEAWKESSPDPANSPGRFYSLSLSIGSTLVVVDVVAGGGLLGSGVLGFVWLEFKRYEGPAISFTSTSSHRHLNPSPQSTQKFYLNDSNYAPLFVLYRFSRTSTQDTTFQDRFGTPLPLN